MSRFWSWLGLSSPSVSSESRSVQQGSRGGPHRDDRGRHSGIVYWMRTTSVVTAGRGSLLTSPHPWVAPNWLVRNNYTGFTELPRLPDEKAMLVKVNCVCEPPPPPPHTHTHTLFSFWWGGGGGIVSFSYIIDVSLCVTLPASLSGTFPPRKDVVNQYLEFVMYWRVEWKYVWQLI